jgi:G-patch domain
MKLPAGYVPGLLQQHKATAKGGFGERLLRQYGWTEGKGLGANETGIAEALRVKQKKDQTGVNGTLLLLSIARLQVRLKR